MRSGEAALSESAGRWVVTSSRTLASEAIVRPSGPRPSFDGGRGPYHAFESPTGPSASICVICGFSVDGFVMPSCFCVFVFAMLCALSVSLWFFG